MIILAITNSFWNFYNFRMNLLSRIENDIDCNIHLAAPKDKYIKRIAGNFKFHTLEFKSRTTNPISDFLLLIRIRSLVKKIKPDIILTFTIKPNIYTSLIAKKMKIPIINNISGLGTIFIKKNITTKIAQLLYKTSFSKYNYVLFQNEYDLDEFKKKKLLNNSKYGIIPGSGINTSEWSDNVLNNRGKKILFCARLIKDKGINEYLESARIIKRKYPDIIFNVVGPLGVDNKTSISKNLLNEFIVDNSINYLGKSNDMKEIIKNNDIIVLPSYREGMSRFLLESASMSKPIITTNVPGCREIVQDSINGFLCEPKNSFDLANKIEKMINISEHDRIKFGNNGRKLMIENFEESKVTGKYIQIIKNI